MMHHHQRFYQYGGPPSIVMGTWGDRKSSRSTFAPPPAPFAIPPAGVPGGRMGPAPTSRMSAGYHSLQYTPPVKLHHEQPNMPPSVMGHPVVLPPSVMGHPVVLENNHKKGSSAKYTRDGSDHHHHQIHKLPQVTFFSNFFFLYLEKKFLDYCYVIRTVHCPTDS